MLHSCINDPSIKNDSNCHQSSLNIISPSIEEGFTSDMTSGPGVSYVSKDKCPDGHTKINGKCYQVCRGCNYNDSSGYFGDSSKFPFGENSKYNSSCGPDHIFEGIDQSGFIRCKKGTRKINTIDDDFNISPFV